MNLVSLDIRCRKVLYISISIILFLNIRMGLVPEYLNSKVETSYVSFTSTAPLETIKASSTNLTGVLDTAKREFAFKIDMGSFVGFRNPLQKEHFEENYLEIERYKYALFTGKIIEESDLGKEGVHELRGKGFFNLHGVSREKTIKCKVDSKKGIYFVTATFPIKLSDYKITIPQQVKQKIAEEIMVTITIKIK